MKKNILTCFTLIAIHLHTQTLVDNKIDDFTGAKILSTSWEMLTPQNMKFVSFFRIRTIDSIYYLEVKLMTDRIYSISEGSSLMFKLDTGEIVKLYNTEYQITCTGCGARGFSGSAAPGTHTKYKITKENLIKLKEQKVLKVRIYLSDSYVEEDLKDKQNNFIDKAIDLILNNK